MESSNPSVNMSQESVAEIQPYTYHALSEGEFRLLSLQPGPFESPLSISLEHRILSESSKTYEALSYAWGTSAERFTIDCGIGQLQVTPSLLGALHHLRSTTTTRVLWIDAICINQEDVEERSKQVPLMRYIYPQASQVVVWVGEEDDTSRLAMSTFEEWSNFFTEDIFFMPHIRQKFQSRFGSSHEFESTVKAISCFLRRPWFSRSWALQEISLSQGATILCGKVEMPWNSLHRAYVIAFGSHLDPFRLEYEPQVFPTCVQVMFGSWLDWNKGRTPDALPQILAMSAQFEASDPRDKIYSLLSLADIKDLSLYVPRYDMSVCDAYTIATLATIKDTNDLSMLTSINRASPDSELPSWVLDLRKAPMTTRIYLSGIYNVNHNILPTLNRLEITLSPEIHLDGACVDQISKTYSLTGLKKDLMGKGREGFTVSLSSFSEHINLSDEYSITGESMPMALFRTLNLDRGFLSKRQDELGTEGLIFAWHHLSMGKSVLDRAISDAPQRIRDAKEAASYNVAIRKVYKKLPLNYTQATNTSLRPFLHHLPFGKSYHKDAITLHNISNEASGHIAIQIENRSFFITKRGYIGIGADTTKPGDILCTLNGSQVPFILRSVGGSEKFRLIDESYVHGIMDGELWKETEDGMIEPAAEGMELRSFTLV